MEASGYTRAPAVLHLGRYPLYPFDKRLFGPQSRSGQNCDNRPASLVLIAVSNTAVNVTHNIWFIK
jgi:hypothetical protein